MLLYEDLTKGIIDAAMEVHKTLRAGFLESVYQNALAKELMDRRIQFESQMPLDVYYKETKVGEYFADMVIEGKVIIELKATSMLIPKNEAQAINYLAATKIRLALLLNFGTPKLQIKRIIK
jgi:GxxExxY protein